MLLYVVLGVLLGVLGAVLIAPWRIDLYLHKAAESTQVSVRAHLRWVFFGWRIDDRGTRARRASQPAPKTVARPSGGGGFAAMRAALGTPGLIARVCRFIVELGRQAWPRDVALRGRIGFDDPADTGIFIGTCYGLTCAVPHPGWHVEIEPDFRGPALEGEAHARWSVRLIAVAWPIVTFIASPVVWRGIGSAMRARRL